jgi:hypothetical protein
MADGSVHFLGNSTAVSLLFELAIRNDGKPTGGFQFTIP